MKIKNHKVEGVRFVQSPNVGGELTKPTVIILHDTASGLKDDGDIAWLTNPKAKVSAHVVNNRSGVLTQLVPFNRVAWHAGQSKLNGRSNVNSFGIGIEIDNPGRLSKIGNFTYQGIVKIQDDTETPVAYAETKEHGKGYWLAYTDAQIATVVELCRALVAQYPSITMIETHWKISPGRKFDTNPLFPLEAVREKVFGGRTNTPEIAHNNFSPDATVMAAPTLNLRAGPGVQYPVIAELSKGTRLDVQETDALTGWYRVVVGSATPRTGFVNASYVKLDD